MELKVLKTLMDAMAGSDLSEMTFSQDGWTLRLSRNAISATPRDPVLAPIPSEGVPKPAPEPALAQSADPRSPLAGIAHLRPAPDAEPYVRSGQSLRVGDTVCLIEAMKVFNPVRVTRDGTVAEILVASGEEVSAGQILMRIV